MSVSLPRARNARRGSHACGLSDINNVPVIFLDVEFRRLRLPSCRVKQRERHIDEMEQATLKKCAHFGGVISPRYESRVSSLAAIY